MTRKFSGNLIPLILPLIVGLAACAKSDLNASSAPVQSSYAVPASWILPENRVAAVAEESRAANSDAEASLSPGIERLFSVSRSAVDRAVPASPESSAASSTKPSDWVPWHMEFFTTDLSVTASGKIGVLTVAGNPWVQAFWRRQNVPAQTRESAAPAAETPTNSALAVALNESTTADDLSNQVDTMARAAMATGKVNDESALRANLSRFSAQFRDLVQALEAADQQPVSGSEWWVSRLRVDLIVAASGTIGIAPTTLGGNLRLRFEWARLSPKNQSTTDAPVTDARVGSNALMDSAKSFVLGMKSDLAVAAAGAYSGSGVYPYQIRIGLGMTASGTIGVAKGSAELLGHVYFGSNASKPAVNPPVPAPSGSIALIENAPDPAHLKLAAHTGVPYDGSPDGVVYHIAHDKFAAGLQKAMHMGAFFADRAAEPTTSTWKLYQMYVGFDVSVTGTTGVVSLAGNSSDEIDFYNGNF